MKKYLSIFLSVLLAMSAMIVPFSAYADDSGTCGDKANYTYDATNKILSITGTGAIKTYGPVTVGSLKQPWYSYRGEIKNVVVGEGITSIGAYSLYSFTSLTTVSLPSTLTGISSYAFYKDNLLKTINLGETKLQNININAFENCSALTSVTLPETMTSVSNYAFRNAGVKTVNFPESCTSIGDYAFYGCPIATISLPQTITSVGLRAFANNTFLYSVYIYNADLQFGGNDPFNGAQASLTFYGHSGSTTESYATEKGYKFISIDSCVHSSTNTVITVEPTCLAAGAQQIVCNDCGAVVRTESIAALGHDMQVLQVDDQTVANGHMFTYYRCARCNDAQYDTLTTEHQTDADGKIIWVDGFYTDTVITATTCTVPGVTRRKCTVDDCGKTELIYTPAFGHNVEQWTVSKEATCTTDGTREGVCTNCGETVTETIKGTHTYVCTEGEVDATGHRTDTYTCSNCNDSYTKVVHVNWIDGQYTTRTLTTASCTIAGASRDTCSVCGETRNNVVPMTGHAYKFTTCDGTNCNYVCANCNNATTYALTKVESGYINNIGKVSGFLAYRYDINNDGYVTARDYAKINHFIKGIGVTTPEPTTQPESTTIANE